MESGDEDDAFTMGEREWLKMKQNLSKQGYRDGKSEGREQGRQKSFEQATSLGLKHSIKLGQILGIIDWKLSQSLKLKATTQQQKEKLGAMRDEILGQLDYLKSLPFEKGSEDISKEVDIELDKSFTNLAQQLLSILSDRPDGADQTCYESIIAKMLETEEKI